jgi:hypothetical protein
MRWRVRDRRRATGEQQRTGRLAVRLEHAELEGARSRWPS